jgi:hypothetical protein
MPYTIATQKVNSVVEPVQKVDQRFHLNDASILDDPVELARCPGLAKNLPKDYMEESSRRIYKVEKAEIICPLTIEFGATREFVLEALRPSAYLQIEELCLMLHPFSLLPGKASALHPLRNILLMVLIKSQCRHRPQMLFGDIQWYRSDVYTAT